MNPSKMAKAIDQAYTAGPERVRAVAAQQLAGWFKDVPNIEALAEAHLREVRDTAADPTKPAGSLYKIGDAPATDALYHAVQKNMPHDLAGARVWDTKAPGWHEFWTHKRAYTSPDAARTVAGFHARGCRFIVMVEMAAGPYEGACGVTAAETPESAAVAAWMLYRHMVENFGANQLLMDFYATDEVADAVGAVLRKLQPRTVEMTTDELQAAFKEGR